MGNTDAQVAETGGLRCAHMDASSHHICKRERVFVCVYVCVCVCVCLAEVTHSLHGGGG